VTIPLADLLRTHDVASGHVERSIFGARDADAIAALIAATAEHQLGTPVAGGLFYAASSGCVFGLRLEDGRSIVLKAYQSHWEQRFLRAVQRVQRAVAGTGFPCPMPLAGPVAVGRGSATIESLLPDPGPDDRFDESYLERSSAGLVALLHSARGLAPDDLELHPSRMAEGELYPIPHNPIFDLQGTAEGAEWIDEWARRAWSRRSSDALPGVIAYLDWSARNVRMGPTGVVAVYDWDSVSVASEATTAGQAAATWRSTGDTTDIGAPDAGEIARFVLSFTRALGRPFSVLEMDVAHAAAVWVMAYAARCEHALEQRTPWRRTQAREWLATQAELLLS
jgi:hypothetical protein